MAPPYFSIDLEYEIKWHDNHLKKLHSYKKNPSRFHRSMTSHAVTHDRLAHFKEHVIEAIPFHSNLLGQHKTRLELIKQLIPLKVYRKITNISLNGGTPEYFVYDKLKKELFFVAEHINDERKKWIDKTKKFVRTIILEK